MESYYQHNNMGSCLSQKTLRQMGQIKEFKTDQLLQEDISKPMTTSLYTLFRKPKQMEIIRESPGDPILQGQTQPHLSRIRTNDMKMLYNFKNILAIDDIPNSLQILKQMVNLKSIYKVTSKQAKEFAREYPIFAFNSHNQKKERRAPTSLPLLVFHSKELLHEPSEKFLLFLHSKKHQNEDIYQELNIDEIINYPEEGGSDEVFIEQFKNLKGGKILLIHSDNIGGNQLLNILAESLSKRYSLSLFNCKSYLYRFFPNLCIIDKEKETFVGQSGHQIDQNSLSEKMYKLLTRLDRQHSKKREKTQRAFSLLCTLISNIYSHPQNSDSYRKVKVTNSQLYQFLSKYKSGKKLLEEAGWKEQSGFWVNNVELKYLKIYRTELEVAYGRFKRQT